MKSLPATARILGLLAAIFLVWHAGLASAQEPTTQQLQQRLDQLERELQELRAETAESRQKPRATLLPPVTEAPDVQPATTIGSLHEAPAAMATPGGAKGEPGKAQGQTGKELDGKKQDEPKKGDGQDQWFQVGSDFKMSASWNNGLVIQSANKDFLIHLGGRFDQDWVWFDQDPALMAPAPRGVGDLQDGVFFRRARFKMDGTAWEVFDWSTEVNFENINQVTFQDFWVGVNQVPLIGTIRVGNNRVPQGLEAFTSENFNTFMERAAPFDIFLQNFNPGLFFANTAFDQHLTWQTLLHRTPAAGIPPSGFSGTNAGNNANSGADFEDGAYAATGRLTLLPYYAEGGRCWVHLGSSYQYRNTRFDASTGRDEVQFRVRPEIFTSNGFVGVNNRFLDSGLIEANNVQTIGTEFATVVGPFSVQAESWLVHVGDAFTGAGKARRSLGDPNFYGFYVQVSYFLTGESRTYDRRFGRLDRIRPFTNVWLVKAGEGITFGWGAWEIAARYSLVNLNDTPVVVGTGGQLSQYTLGVNWYLNPNMRVQWNYVRANRNVPAPNFAGNADLFGMVFHVDF
jgi:phosphate-selective porin OprO/OprP